MVFLAFLSSDYSNYSFQRGTWTHPGSWAALPQPEFQGPCTKGDGITSSNVKKPTKNSLTNPNPHTKQPRGANKHFLESPALPSSSALKPLWDRTAANTGTNEQHISTYRLTAGFNTQSTSSFPGEKHVTLPCCGFGDFRRKNRSKLVGCITMFSLGFLWRAG